MELRASARHPSPFRSESDREKRVAPEGADEADQAQGCRPSDQRMRRGARGRADLPPDRAAREGQAAGPAPVAAVDDARRDPRRLRAPAHRHGHAAARRCRALPLGGRLARRHQRHARDDGVQQQGRRLLPDDRRPRADAHAVDRRRARGEDSPLRAARLLGSARGIRLRRRFLRRPLVRSEVQEGRIRPRKTRFAPLEPACRRDDRRRVPRPPRHGHRGIEAVDAAFAAAVRPDEPAARGEQPLRLLREEHARPGAGAVREAQGAHLSAYRRARCRRTTSAR